MSAVVICPVCDRQASRLIRVGARTCCYTCSRQVIREVFNCDDPGRFQMSVCYRCDNVKIDLPGQRLCVPCRLDEIEEDPSSRSKNWTKCDRCSQFFTNPVTPKEKNFCFKCMRELAEANVKYYSGLPIEEGAKFLRSNLNISARARSMLPLPRADRTEDLNEAMKWIQSYSEWPSRQNTAPPVFSPRPKPEPEPIDPTKRVRRKFKLE